MSFRKFLKESESTLAWHGSPFLFKKFSTKNTPQGILWFAEDVEDIKGGTSGAVGTKYLYKVQLTVNNPANWDLYDKLSLGQIWQQGYDSIKLQDKDGSTTWAIPNTKSIKILETYERIGSDYKKL